MRRHRNADSYLSSFVSCAQRVRELPEKEQMDLTWDFDGDELEDEEPEP